MLVKLDLFHAVKRINTTLHKKHPLSHQCRQDWQLIFRKDGDSGTQRMEPTPEPDVINTRLENFMSKWKMKVQRKCLHQTHWMQLKN